MIAVGVVLLNAPKGFYVKYRQAKCNDWPIEMLCIMRNMIRYLGVILSEHVNHRHVVYHEGGCIIDESHKNKVPRMQIVGFGHKENGHSTILWAAE